MKKLLLIALMLPFATLALRASISEPQKKDTVIVVKNPASVTIKEKEGTIGVEVRGSENNPDFFYSSTINIPDSSTIIAEERMVDWNFNIPFMNKKSEKKYKDRITMGGLGFGFVNALNSPAQMNVNMGASWEIMMDHWLNFEYHPWRTSTFFSIGIGTTWRNYRMNGMTRFIKDGSDIKFGSYPEGADIEYSRLKVFSITVPLMWNQTIYKGLSFSLGPVINFNTHGSMKTYYKMNGEKIKLTNNNIHQNPVTLDLMGTLQFKSVGFYLKYSPTHVLNTDYGPKFISLSTGITLFY